jgi:AcrR family transcriptional regulator
MGETVDMRAAADLRARRRLTAEERKAQIVDTAAELFDQGGFSSTTMEDIAARLGIGKTTLYHYFTSKDEILFAIHETFIDLLLERHARRVAAQLDNAQVLLLEVMGDIVELMETHRGHIRVFFEHHREMPEAQRAALLVKRDQYDALVTDLFARAIESGQFRQTDPHLAALAMFGMCNWTYQWYRPGQDLRSRDIAYTFWGLLMHGLVPDGPAPD